MAAQEKTREFPYTWDDFNHLRVISNEYSGILVPDDKFDMFYSRLSKRLRVLGVKSFEEYCRYLDSHGDSEFTHFINAITTNLTSFFRENHHFETLRERVLPEIVAKNRTTRKIRVWSAGCSTGEEAYSLAITLKENMPADWNLKILATDLDTHVLNTAAQGIYALDRMQGLSEQRLKRWFNKGKGTQAGKIRVKAELRELIRFKQLNLMQDNWPMQNHFDFIFCRNVFIYFDQNTKRKLVSRYAQLLRSGSYLFIGHSESLNQVTQDFKSIGHTLYQRI
ncbi:MAG: CheR family methyltransferase [Gammaproteobacteria bacterium]